MFSWFTYFVFGYGGCASCSCTSSTCRAFLLLGPTLTLKTHHYLIFAILLLLLLHPIVVVFGEHLLHDGVGAFEPLAELFQSVRIVQVCHLNDLEKVLRLHQQRQLLFAFKFYL